MRDGTKIAVGDMDIDHLRNTLRMIIRTTRKRRRRADLRQALDEITVGEAQDILAGDAYRNLANPQAYFPLLGCFGSPELQQRVGRR